MSETLDRQERWKQQKEEADRQRMGGAYIQGFIETAAALGGEEPLFSKGYWKCANGGKPFGFGLARTPRESPGAHMQLRHSQQGPYPISSVQGRNSRFPSSARGSGLTLKTSHLAKRH